MTNHKYKEGISKRILVAKEVYHRTHLPVIVINLDGVIGYFDQCYNYHMKQADLIQIISLSNNFRIVAFAINTSKNMVKRLCK